MRPATRDAIPDETCTETNTTRTISDNENEKATSEDVDEISDDRPEVDPEGGYPTPKFSALPFPWVIGEGVWRLIPTFARYEEDPVPLRRPRSRRSRFWTMIAELQNVYDTWLGQWNY